MIRDSPSAPVLSAIHLLALELPSHCPSQPFFPSHSQQHFITAMDSLKLNMVAVDQIFPLLSDLVSAMMKVGGRRSSSASQGAPRAAGLVHAGTSAGSVTPFGKGCMHRLHH